MDIKLTESKVPAPTKKPNPYLAHAQRLADDRDLAFEFDVPKNKDDEQNDKDVRNIIAKWQDAGTELGVTIRAKREGNHVTVYARDKITRKSSTDVPAPAADVAPAAK